MAKERITWLNWNSHIQDATPLPDDRPDTRTGTYCREDTMDLVAYHGYLKVCGMFKKQLTTGTHAKSSVVSGPAYMYDLGFIPVTMVPSYWDSSFAEMMYKAVTAAGLPIYSRTPVGLSYYTFNNKRTAGQAEWWVSRMDIAERLGIGPESVTFKEVCKVCGLALH